MRLSRSPRQFGEGFGREQVPQRNVWGGIDMPNYDPIARLMELENRYQQFPGAAPQGTGPTGIQTANQYSDMLNDRIEYMKLKAGDPNAIKMRHGGNTGSTRTIAPATGRYAGDTFGQSAGVSGAALEGLRSSMRKKPNGDAAYQGYLRSSRGRTF